MSYDKPRFKGQFKFQCFNADGTLAWEEVIDNAPTNEGLNKILDVMFHATAQITTWYIGLVDNSGFSAFAAADTLASHAGWTENTNYSGNRKEWTEAAASGQSITSSSASEFTINASVTIKGAFVASVDSGTSGTLWATGAFSSNQSLVNTQVLRVTYTVSASGS